MMAAEPKKISFGFTKTLKKATDKPEEKKQFIDCLEGKSIKVKGGEIIEERAPLVIPLKSKTTTAASLMRIAQEVENGILDTREANDESEVSAVPKLIIPAPANESLEERAVRELMQDVKKSTNDKQDVLKNSLTIPAVETPVFTGEKESTIHDYDNIPVAQFGLAMLRGMGWAPGKGMGKHKAVGLALPTLRPKGMGLGADKVTIQQKNGEKPSEKKEEQEELKIVKGSFVKMIAGKHAGTYGQISGFDEDSGRLIVKSAIGGLNINLSEFMVEAVTKNEYNRSSKVINSAKYEEYKKKENTLKTSRPDEKSHPVHSTNDRHSESNQKHSRKDDITRHHSSSRSERERDDKSSKSSHRSRHEERHRKNSESSSDSSTERRNRDKKRKGKKKKRDRSRSKEHRRH
ncbi:G-patch domain and KOW motifs-containing protein [Arctopsyche grandis]|uniref:G-patch domain and KOW motifs-containing protein n=1 Tax=Arctopsyche grandis TaxID=121162 RepID=UPI00406D736D